MSTTVFLHTVGTSSYTIPSGVTLLEQVHCIGGGGS